MYVVVGMEVVTALLYPVSVWALVTGGPGVTCGISAGGSMDTVFVDIPSAISNLGRDFLRYKVLMITLSYDGKI